MNIKLYDVNSTDGCKYPPILTRDGKLSAEIDNAVAIIRDKVADAIADVKQRQLTFLEEAVMYLPQEFTVGKATYHLDDCYWINIPDDHDIQEHITYLRLEPGYSSFKLELDPVELFKPDDLRKYVGGVLIDMDEFIKHPFKYQAVTTLTAEPDEDFEDSSWRAIYCQSLERAIIEVTDGLSELTTANMYKTISRVILNTVINRDKMSAFDRLLTITLSRSTIEVAYANYEGREYSRPHLSVKDPDVEGPIRYGTRPVQNLEAWLVAEPVLHLCTGLGNSVFPCHTESITINLHQVFKAPWELSGLSRSNALDIAEDLRSSDFNQVMSHVYNIVYNRIEKDSDTATGLSRRQQMTMMHGGIPAGRISSVGFTDPSAPVRSNAHGRTSVELTPNYSQIILPLIEGPLHTTNKTDDKKPVRTKRTKNTTKKSKKGTAATSKSAEPETAQEAQNIEPADPVVLPETTRNRLITNTVTIDVDTEDSEPVSDKMPETTAGEDEIEPIHDDTNKPMEDPIY